MNMDDPQKINDGSSAKELISEIQTMSTFTEVKDWGWRARVEIERIEGILRGLDVEIARTAEALEKIRYDQTKKSLVGRLFGGTSDDKEISERLDQYRQSKSDLAADVLRLQESIDFTPKSPDEQKALLLELRDRKRQLGEKRREITAVIRGPRPMGQAQGGQMDAVFDNATIDRRKARYAREAELLPQEKTRESIDRQIARVDRDILWVEKFQ